MEEYNAPQEPVKVYENTYIMEPSAEQRFKRSAVTAILDDILKSKMEFTNKKKNGRYTFVYSPEDANDTAKEIVEEAQHKVLAKMTEDNGGNPPRYKLCYQASMGESNNQMIRQASRALWDPDFDNSAHAFWDNGRLWASIIVWALYFE